MCHGLLLCSFSTFIERQSNKPGMLLVYDNSIKRIKDIAVIFPKLASNSSGGSDDLEDIRYVIVSVDEEV